jgi:meso-butanediol dehydrogenase/(S,S)-butanediol dehydrogenase/diacetyl reductase
MGRLLQGKVSVVNGAGSGIVSSIALKFAVAGMRAGLEALWEAELRAGGFTPNSVRELYIIDTPLGRLETPDDVSRVVLFLASNLSDFITAEAINVNGGSWMD